MGEASPPRLAASSLAERARVHAALGEPHRLAIVDALTLTDRAPGELEELTGTASNLLAHHLAVLEEAGIVERRRSEGDGRRRYVRLRTDGLHDLALRPPPVSAASVLFVCSHNAARSQLAAALWRSRSSVAVASAGTEPADAVHPDAVAVARDRGLDLGHARPRRYDEVQAADLVVSVCDRAGEDIRPEAPVRLHWSIPDPIRAGGPAAFRAAFDQLAPRIDLLARAIEVAA